MNWRQLKAGDWLFRHAPGWLSDAIADAEDTVPGPGPLDGDNPSHVAAVVEEVDGSLTVREMTSPRACSTPLESWIEDGRTWAMPGPELFPEQKVRLRAAADSAMGRIYDYLQIPVLWVRLTIRKIRAWWGGKPLNVKQQYITGVCSENVIRWTEAALTIDVPDWMVSPLDMTLWVGDGSPYGSLELVEVA